MVNTLRKLNTKLHNIKEQEYYGKHHDIMNWCNIFVYLELPELVPCGERENKMEVMFTDPLKSVSEIQIGAEFNSRVRYALPHIKKIYFCQPPIFKYVSVKK